MNRVIPTLGGYQIWSDIWVRSGWRVQRSTATDAVRLLTPSHQVAASGPLEFCLREGHALAPPPTGERGAILLHGLGRGRHVMRQIEQALEQAGLTVANVGYPSLRRPLAHHADAVRSVARGLHADGVHPVALVGHSLGGLIARAAAAEAAADGWPLGRIVLLGSPARGSAIANALKDVAAYRLLAGGGGLAVTAEEAARVPVPDTEIAVIAGGNGAAGYNPFLAGDNDGVVTVAETRLPGAEADFMLLPCVHTVLPMRTEAVAATLRFLERGRLR